MELTKRFYCPSNAWDCPYWRKNGTCAMVDEGDDPVEECDDAGAFWDVEDTEQDYFVWADEKENLYNSTDLLEKGYHFVNGEPVLPNSMSDYDFLDMARDKFTEEEWDRLCDLLAK